MKGLLVDADKLLVELQNVLSLQEMKFGTFIEQQHEVHRLSRCLIFTLFSILYCWFQQFFKNKIKPIQELSRNLERTKSVSATTMNFFRTVDSHALELKKVLEKSHMAHQKQLFQLQKKFEVTFCCIHIFSKLIVSL